MAKAGELCWDELIKTGKVEQDPADKARIAALNLPDWDPKEVSTTLKKGEVPRKPSNEEIAKAILQNAPKQPTDEQLFGGGVVSEEEARRRLQEWETRLQKSLTMPNIGKPVDEDDDWGNGRSFNSTLSKEELAKRNMHLGDDE